MRGTIVKGIAGFYYVKEDETGRVVQCRARGLFRKEKITPYAGDTVSFEQEEEQDGVITEIAARKNVFIRPPIAIVDCFCIVCAAA